ncbi:uncharacterized protein LOC108679192 [Hyalella azteca]|uniref:Uncharacterized protein LOC108679192 n=1 Tax=Hyalella azteca TaxID=294128 RepID=A0A8B7PBA4_HYAAZ|nr:uncharacterized protein LOC108679192 [Hyalella azteca]
MKQNSVLVLVVSLVVNVRGLPMLDPGLCDGAHFNRTEYYCGSCLQPFMCEDGELIELPRCILGSVCEEVDSGPATCVPATFASVCECTTDVCDDYNPAYTAKCDANGLYDIVECTGVHLGSAACVSGTCVDCSNLGIRDPVYEVVPSECTIGYQCTDQFVTASTDCSDEEYVSKEGSCVPAPPLPCADEDLCFGICPDLTNCSRYYFCDINGGPPAGPYECDVDHFFNPRTEFCELGDPSVCDLWTQCDFQN